MSQQHAITNGPGFKTFISRTGLFDENSPVRGSCQEFVLDNRSRTWIKVLSVGVMIQEYDNNEYTFTGHARKPDQPGRGDQTYYIGKYNTVERTGHVLVLTAEELTLELKLVLGIYK
jgi:hypothetical protein